MWGFYAGDVSLLCPHFGFIHLSPGCAFSEKGSASICAFTLGDSAWRVN